MVRLTFSYSSSVYKLTVSSAKGRVQGVHGHHPVPLGLGLPGTTVGGAVVLQMLTNAITRAPAPMGDASTLLAPTPARPVKRGTEARVAAV